ncbi:helix-turn-helix domain-containing protein [Cytobacillus praedii]|uniref:helix-turn-helix domain-containing protein n=1 Tax=Cytobacillus praedii TaxID=1742358 RepID=UPI003F7DBE64
MFIGVLAIINNNFQEDEYERVTKIFPNIKVLGEKDFFKVEKVINQEKYKLIVFITFEESFPDSWKIDEIQTQSPIMILLKVNLLDLFVFSSFLDSVGLLAKPNPQRHQEKNVNPLLYQSLLYIEENWSDNSLSLDEVASNVFLSKCHFSRIFKEKLGTGFKQYLMQKRIQEAKNMLKRGISVTDTCFAVGYGDLTHFGRVFKNLVGITPSQYRKKNISKEM